MYKTDNPSSSCWDCSVSTNIVPNVKSWTLMAKNPCCFQLVNQWDTSGQQLCWHCVILCVTNDLIPLLIYCLSEPATMDGEHVYTVYAEVDTLCVQSHIWKQSTLIYSKQGTCPIYAIIVSEFDWIVVRYTIQLLSAVTAVTRDKVQERWDRMVERKEGTWNSKAF